MRMLPFRSRALLGAALAAVMTGGSGLALAQPQPSPEMRAQARAIGQICQTDIRQLCRGVAPGGGRILACMQKNADRLSQPCRDAMSKASQAGVSR